MEGHRIRTIRTGSTYRLLAASDLHGHLSVFREALEKAQYRPGEDYLLILGDFIMKGPENAAMLDYLRELSATPRVHILLGNCDEFADRLTLRKTDEELLSYNRNWPGNLFVEWAAALGFRSVTADNVAAARRAVAARYMDRIEWLRTLPLAIETDDYIFVHAGLDDLPDWRDSDPAHVLRFDDFFHAKHRAPKPVVVGHWPVFNYIESGATCLPVTSGDGRTVGIDGGCGVKRGGQINVLIVESRDGVRSSRTVFADALPKLRAVRTVEAPPQPVFKLDYLNPFVDIVGRGPYFSLCRARHNGTQGYIKNEHIWTDREGRLCVYSSLSTQLSVHEGEELSLIDGQCAGYALVRGREGAMGWIPKTVVGLR